MRPCDATDTTQAKGCFPSKVIGGQPVVVHNREQHTGPAAAACLRRHGAVDRAVRSLLWPYGTGRGHSRPGRHSQVEKLIIHRVQCPSFDLGPLAADQWEEVWWTKLHNHEGITQA